MKKIVTLLLIISFFKTNAQNSSYIYIEGIKEKPFTIQLDGKNVPDYGGNYVIIPKVDEGTHRVNILIDKNIVQTVTLQIAGGKQYGYKLNANEEGKYYLTTIANANNANTVLKQTAIALKNEPELSNSTDTKIYSKEAKKHLAELKAREEFYASQQKAELPKSEIIYSKETKRKLAEIKEREDRAQIAFKKQEENRLLAESQQLYEKRLNEEKIAKENREFELINKYNSEIKPKNDSKQVENIKVENEKTNFQTKITAFSKEAKKHQLEIAKREEEAKLRFQASIKKINTQTIDAEIIAKQKALLDVNKLKSKEAFAIKQEEKDKIDKEINKRNIVKLENNIAVNNKIVQNNSFSNNKTPYNITINSQNTQNVFSKEAKKHLAEIAKREEEAKLKEQKSIEKLISKEEIQLNETAEINSREAARLAKLKAKEEQRILNQIKEAEKQRLNDEANEREKFAKEEKRKLKIGEITDNTKLINNNDDAKKAAKDAEREYAKTQRKLEKQKEIEDVETKKLWAKEIAENKRAAEEKAKLVLANNAELEASENRTKFENKTNKVKYKLNTNCKHLISETELVGTFQKLESKYDDDARLKVIRKSLSKENCYLCKDIEQMALAFNTQNGKFEFVKLLFPYVQNQDDYKTLENIFKFEPYKQRVRMEFGGEM